jgi:CheY-like chemotaxis protein/predicted Ser/Thr protein kinase
MTDRTPVANEALSDGVGLIAQPPQAALHVLLVEDNPADAAIGHAFLAQGAEGPAQVQEAGTLAAAIAALGRERYDVIVLDLSLPDSGGLDTFISLHTRTALTPVVVLSGLDSDELVLDAVRMGAQDFLVKGHFNAPTLQRSLRFAITRHRLVEQMKARRSTSTLQPAHARPSSDGSDDARSRRIHPDLPRLPLETSDAAPLSTHGTGPGNRTAVTTSRFTLAGALGSGGMSEVVLAHQVNLGREVAVKFVRPGYDRRRLEQFQAEARVTAYLEHPGVVPIYDMGDTFFVMRRVHGSTLASLIERQRGDADLPFFIEVLLKVCDVLAFAHSRGIIHRDLKPENIMVGDFGQVVLLDWGLALTATPPSDGRWVALPIPKDPQDVCAGTLGFLAAEIARGNAEQVGFGTDVFLIGATLYCVLTGQPPYEGSAQLESVRAAARVIYPPVHERHPGVPRALEALQCRAMDPDPHKRGSISDFARDLRQWLRHGDGG